LTEEGGVIRPVLDYLYIGTRLLGAVRGGRLVVVKNGSGSGTVTGAGITCGPTCVATLTTGTTVTLTASAAAGSQFAGWVGDCTGGGATVSFVFGGSAHCTARFIVPTPLSATVGTTGAGTVTSTPPGISCPGPACTANFDRGTLVTLTATPAAAWAFTGWSGDADCADGVVAVGAVAGCTANFEPLVTKLGPADGATISGSIVNLSWSSRLAWPAYYVCWDTSDNGACDSTWWPNAASTTRQIAGLSDGTYYWPFDAAQGHPERA
jgi:hypothetical protein